MSYEARKTNELFDGFERQLHGRYRAMYLGTWMTRHNVYVRTAELKREGYAEDTAFAKALIEYGFEV
jgi:glycine cleavage system protein P-like pyridoxal-binding family